MQAFDFDYCDTYESYGSSGVMLENNGFRMFTCHECRGKNPFVKKSVNDSRFRCDNCIQNQNRNQNQNQNQNEVQEQVSYFSNSLVLEMPQTTTARAAPPSHFPWRWLQFFT